MEVKIYIAYQHSASRFGRYTTGENMKATKHQVQVVLGRI